MDEFTERKGWGWGDSPRCRGIVLSLEKFAPKDGSDTGTKAILRSAKSDKDGKLEKGHIIFQRVLTMPVTL